MCIAIVTTEHPQYPFILLNNRDEYLHRPTAEAVWWDPPSSHVLGGYDLYRSAHGTWLGVTRQGRFAVLTNYREDGEVILSSARSRGTLPNGYLKPDPKSLDSPEEYAQRLVAEDGTRGVGGFSLLYGKIQDVIKNHKGLAIISNRTPDVDGLIWVAQKPETLALSNSFFGDETWPKVVDGKRATTVAVQESVEQVDSKEQLIKRFFDILSSDTMPRQKTGEEWDMYLNKLRHSIFIPGLHNHDMDSMPPQTMSAAAKEVVNATHGVYGTQKQTIILVNTNGALTYVERTLFDGNGVPIEKGKGDKTFEFQIEDW